jgi:predicted phage baseplate assembly protein
MAGMGVRGVGAVSAASSVPSSRLSSHSGLSAWLGGGREQIFARARTVRTLSRASYGITGRVTQLTLDAAWLKEGESSLSVLRDTAIYAQAEALTPAEAPLGEALPANDIELTGDYSMFLPGRRVIITGQLAGSAADGPWISELAEVKLAAPSGPFTRLTLVKNLANSFRRDSVTINANVTPATHGETVSEVLGSGDGSAPYQRFTLRQAPLTHVSAETPSGTETTLEVRVNDVLWHETSTLLDRGPRDRVYTARAGDDGKLTVLFGDGRSGARLPSGTENVRATYRKGIGKAGNVKAGQLSLLLTRPLGVRAALNPLPAAGGDDPETLDRARRNAPLTVLTLDRIVSLRDYEDFARAFGGIAKALATWTWDGQRQGVFVTVAGVDGAALDENGETFRNLVAAMQNAGDPYVPLRVKSYAEARFRLAAVVTRHPDSLSDKVEADVRAALRRYFAFDARAFGQPVTLSEVMAAIQAVPGVVAVDVDALHRLDLVGGAGLQMRLPAAAPQPGGTSSPAELLTLAAGDIDLAVA